MRILGARSCLLAGKLHIFKQMLTTWNANKIKKKRRMRILSARIFSKSFGGKIVHG